MRVKGSAEILLVRHPETEANVTGRYVGRGDSPYTEVGLAQLERVPPKVADFRPERIWTSPLERALRLATRSAALADAPMEVDERLVELDFGEAEGLTYDEILAAGMPFNYRNAAEPVAPGGESRSQIEHRAASVMDEIVRTGGRHVVVTHGGIFRSAMIHLLSLSSTDIWAFHVRNAQLGHVRVVEGHGTLEEYVSG